MTTPEPRSTANPTVLAVAAAVMFCFTLAACVAVFVAAPEGANTGSLITILLTSLPASLGAVAALGQTVKARRQLDQLSNGLMDAKIRAGVADVLSNHLIDPGAQQQLEADRAHREDGGR